MPAGVHVQYINYIILVKNAYQIRQQSTTSDTAQEKNNVNSNQLFQILYNVHYAYSTYKCVYWQVALKKTRSVIDNL